MKYSVNCCWQNNRITWLYLLGIAFVALAAVLGVVLGSTPLSLTEIADAFRLGFNASIFTRQASMKSRLCP